MTNRPMFQSDDLARLFAVVDANPFGLLLSAGDAATPVQATPLPLTRAGEDRLLGHLSRGNPQGAVLEGAAVTVLFQGPHAYVSPRWYAARHAVPTWDYVLVRAHGVVRLLADDYALDHAMDDLVERFEHGQWRADILPDAMRAGLRRGVIGFEIVVTRWEGTFKLSQNRSVADREGVIAGLRATGGELDRAVADLVAATLPRQDA